jgi:uncharacterized YigZ family protein
MKRTPYSIPKIATQFSEEILIERKGSRFYAVVGHAMNSEQGKTLLAAYQQQHPKARHHCWAGVYGAPDNSLRYVCQDDGEPSGTAGVPILNVIKGYPIGECVVIVARYFGGTKLGTGGLVRAYGDAAKSALSQSKTATKTPQVAVAFVGDFSSQNRYQRLCHQYVNADVQVDYGAELRWQVTLPESEQEAFIEQLLEASLGELTVKNIEIAII